MASAFLVGALGVGRNRVGTFDAGGECRGEKTIEVPVEHRTGI